MRNRICQMLDIDYPIIQGGMAWVATGELAAAVSEAGGLGIIGAGNAPADIVQAEIHKIKATTDKPYGVNVMLLSPYVDEVIEVVLAEKVPVVTTGAGSPGKYLSALQEQGCKVIPVIASVALAIRLERMGVDALIAEGQECGGHIGSVATMTLVPQVVDAVSIPVIAAGGIADGRGMVAAFALGAEAVQMGTRFVCAEECTAHDNYKQAIIRARARDAIMCGTSTGHPVRALRNQLTRQIEQLEKNNAPKDEIESLGINRLKQAVIDGEVKMGSVMAGQVAGMIKEIKPAKDIVEHMIKEAKGVIKQLGGMSCLR